MHTRWTVRMICRGPFLVPLVFLYVMHEFSFDGNSVLPFGRDDGSRDNLSSYWEYAMKRAVLISTALAGWFDIQPYVSCLFFFCQCVHLVFFILSSGRYVN